MRGQWHRSWLAAALVGALAAPAWAGPSYTFTPIAPPGAVSVQLGGINDAGQVAGYYLDASGTTQNFVYSGGTFTAVNVPGTAPGMAAVTGINNLGQIGGDYTDGTTTHGFILTGSTVQTIDVPGVQTTAVLALNDHGTALVEGFGTTISSLKYYTYQNGTLTELPPGPKSLVSVATGINNAGDVVGYYLTAGATESHGYLLHNGQYTTFDAPGTTNPHDPGLTTAYGINDAGTIVGAYNVVDGVPSLGFVLQNGTYTKADNPLGDELTGTILLGTNNNGVLIGEYSDFNGNLFAFLATPVAVPEPGTLPLAAVTGLAVGGWRLRKRRE